MDLPSWEIVELSLDLFPVPCHKMDGLKVLIFTGLNSSNFCIKELVFWFDGVYMVSLGSKLWSQLKVRHCYDVGLLPLPVINSNWMGSNAKLCVTKAAS